MLTLPDLLDFLKRTGEDGRGSKRTGEDGRGRERRERGWERTGEDWTGGGYSRAATLGWCRGSGFGTLVVGIYL